MCIDDRKAHLHAAVGESKCVALPPEVAEGDVCAAREEHARCALCSLEMGGALHGCA